MRAGYLAAPGRIELDDFPVPEPGAGEVLVRMRRASICGSDLHMAFYGFHREDALGRAGYPGHEGIGEVVVSRSASVPVGQQVLTVPAGDFGGCFAEYQVVDDQHLVPLPSGDERKLLLAQQLGTTIFAMRKFWPTGTDGAGKTAAVLGMGSAGLFFLQLLRRLGFDQVVVSDLVKGRLKVAETLGADVAVHAPDESVAEAIADVTGGRGAELIVEAAGFDALRTAAIEAVADHGTVGCFGFPERAGDAPYPSYTAFRKAVTIAWVSGTQSEPGLVSFREALAGINDGSYQVDYCTGPDYPLEQLPEAMALAYEAGGGAIKLGIDIAD